MFERQDPSMKLVQEYWDEAAKVTLSVISETGARVDLGELDAAHQKANQVVVDALKLSQEYYTLSQRKFSIAVAKHGEHSRGAWKLRNIGYLNAMKLDDLNHSYATKILPEWESRTKELIDARLFKYVGTFAGIGSWAVEYFVYYRHLEEGDYLHASYDATGITVGLIAGAALAAAPIGVTVGASVTFGIAVGFLTTIVLESTISNEDLDNAVAGLADWAGEVDASIDDFLYINQKLENGNILNSGIDVLHHVLLYNIDNTFSPTHADRLVNLFSIVSEQGVEDCLKSLELLFVGMEDTSPISDEEAYFGKFVSVLAAIRAHPGGTLQLLEGASAVIEEQAGRSDETGLATRYALKHLNPFALIGVPSLYDQHNQNHELDLYDRDHAPGAGRGQVFK